jgi:tripartite-type tricarboxylate transporter receptor subunit TctC
MIMRTMHRALAVGALALCGVSHAAYPERTIRVIVPFATGGATDALGRAMCEVLSLDLKQTCIVENKPGAGTAIANAYVSQSPPDGYTLLITTSSFSIVPALSKSLPYGGIEAFSPIAGLGDTPNVMVVRADSPFKTAREFIATAKANPGKYTYGSSGHGSATHLSAELLKSMTSLDIGHAPYKGAMPLITDLLGGHIHAAFSSLPSAMPFIADGRVRPLAVTSASRSARVPETPTFAESGVAGYDVVVWYGVFAPPRLPQALVKRLNQALQTATQNERFREWASREGVVPAISSPEALAQMARSEEARWREVARVQKISEE